MNRYIDADQIKYSRVIIRTEKDEHGFSEKVEYVASVKKIDAMPTADVVPVRHGHWERGEDKYFYWYKCSNCGKEVVSKYSDIVLSNYCPHCGAKMNESTMDQVKGVTE